MLQTARRATRAVQSGGQHTPAAWRCWTPARRSGSAAARSRPCPPRRGVCRSSTTAPPAGRPAGIKGGWGVRMLAGPAAKPEPRAAAAGHYAGPNGAAPHCQDNQQLPRSGAEQLARRTRRRFRPREGRLRIQPLHFGLHVLPPRQHVRAVRQVRLQARADSNPGPRRGAEVGGRDFRCLRDLAAAGTLRCCPPGRAGFQRGRPCWHRALCALGPAVALRLRRRGEWHQARARWSQHCASVYGMRDRVACRDNGAARPNGRRSRRASPPTRRRCAA